MIPIILFLLSIGLQLAAAVFALLLIRSTGRKLAWMLLSLAMVLMAGRRIVSFDMLLTSGKPMHFELPEFIALAISGLMLTGVLLIGAYFRSIQKEKERRRLVEESLRLHEARLKNLLEFQGMEQSTEQEIFEFTLEASLSSLKSDFAFIGKTSEDEAEMIVQVWSKATMQQCTVTDNPIHFDTAKLGLLGAIIRQRRPIIVNDYEASTEFKKGYPPGHVPIQRFLCVPIFRADRIVAVAAVANKLMEYTVSDVSAFTSLLNEMWSTIERKQASSIIRESEERYKRITETVADYIYSVRSEDGAPIETMHSEACVAVTGYTKEEFSADPYLWVEMVVGEDSDRVVQQAKEVIAGKYPLPIEHRIIRKDGTTRWVENSIVPKHDKNGDLISYDGIIRDITERKSAEEALRKSEIQLRTILDSVNAGIVIIDPETHVIVDANDCALKLIGESKNKVIGSRCHGYICPAEEGKCPITDLKQTLDLSERKLLNAKGEKLPILKSVVSITLSDYPLLIESFIDISERDKTESLIKGILESVDEGFVIIDRDYRIVTANRAYAAEVKAPIEDVIGKHCYAVSHHMDKPCHENGDQCAIKEVFDKGEPHEVIHVHLDADNNQVYIKTKAYPLTKDHDGNVLTAIETLINITQEKYLENQLRQAQKMEAVGQLAGGVAHDFNNILSAIIGYGHITLMKMAKEDPQRLNIEHMLEAADRATQLTKDLLLFSRKQVSDLKPVDLNEIISRVEKFLVRVIGEDIACRTILHPNASHGDRSTAPLAKTGNREKEVVVLADEHQLEQVLMNLATNARDSMPRGGEFVVTTGIVRLDEKFVNAHKYGKTGMYALITISDTGKGMDSATRKRVFEPFFTTKEVGKGTGLGLAVVYGIIKQHNGYVNVYSEPGKGTTFSIYLPLIASKKRSEIVEQEEETVPARGKETILLAEDDKSVRKLSSTVLQQAGYTVIEAVDGEDAVKKFKEHKDKIQLLLFDLIMPKLNGKEAYERLQKIKPALKVIFATGYAPEIIRQKASLKEGAHLIFKPVSPSDLLRKVRSVLDGNNGD
jgi:PAS domain S-box-containing protein